MKNIYCITILLLLTAVSLYGQSPLSVRWLNNSKGSSWNLVNDMVIDKKNNIFLVGNFKDTTRNDKRMIGSKEDIFIAKYNSDGDSIWNLQYKSNEYSYIKSIEIGKTGKVFVASYQYNSAKRDSLKNRQNNFTKLSIEIIDENGKKNVFTEIIGIFNADPVKIVESKDNNLFIAGSFKYLVFEDSIYKCYNKPDIYLLQCNQEGVAENLLLLQGYGKNTLNDLKLDACGNPYITGSFEKDLIINNDKYTSKGRSDGFLIKVDEKLNVLYTKQFGGIYNDYGKSIEIDTSNNVVLTGSFSAKFETENNDSLVSKGKLDVFVTKYNPDGELLWTKSFGGSANDYVSSCILNNRNDIYVNGTYRGKIEEGDYRVESQNFSNDIFIAKFSSVGEFRYLESIGDTNTDFAGRMLVDSLNYLYLTGNYNKNMKVLTDTTDTGDNEDFYLTKLYDCDFSFKIKLPGDTSICGDQFIIVADSGFSNYMWNEMGGDHKYTADSTGNYYLKAYDEHGCISLDTIYVKINNPLQVYLGEDMTVKKGEIIRITTNDSFEEYIWSTSENTPYIDINTEDFKKGSYPVSLTTKDENGCITDDNLVVNVEDNIKFSIYPIPARNIVTLQVDNIKPNMEIDYQLITESGKMLFKRSQVTNDISFTKLIGIENLEPGVYYMKVIYNEESSILKVIKL